MLKPFKELYDMDISRYTREREDLSDKSKKYTYLPWDKCLLLLHEHGATDVNFIPLFAENGHSVFINPVDVSSITLSGGNRAKDPYCPEVHVKVVIDDKSGVFAYPLINGSEVITMGKINQQLVNTARQRAFVKGVAILTGLGLKLWEKEESDMPATNREAHSIQVCSNRIREKYADALKRIGNEKELLSQIRIDGKSLSRQQLNNFFVYLKNAALIEHQLERAR